MKLGVTATTLVSRPGEIWIEASGGRSFRVEPDGGLLERPLLARVRWGMTRVCLEAVEAVDGSRTVHEDGLRHEHVEMEMETAVVARFTGPSPIAGHLGVMRGAELHQPLSCKLNPN